MGYMKNIDIDLIELGFDSNSECECYRVVCHCSRYRRITMEHRNVTVSQVVVSLMVGIIIKSSNCQIVITPNNVSEVRLSCLGGEHERSS